MSTPPFTRGDRIRPAGDGERRNREIIPWTMLRGTVDTCWLEGCHWRVAVRWDYRCKALASTYGNLVPADLLVRA